MLYLFALYFLISFLKASKISYLELISPTSMLYLKIKISCSLGSISYIPVLSLSELPPYAYSTPPTSTPIIILKFNYEIHLKNIIYYLPVWYAPKPIKSTYLLCLIMS